ncbi:MAG: hypothetical protein AB8G11_19295 [Saprospiraceae bacterium]
MRIKPKVIRVILMLIFVIIAYFGILYIIETLDFSDNNVFKNIIAISGAIFTIIKLIGFERIRVAFYKFSYGSLIGDHYVMLVYFSGINELTDEMTKNYKKGDKEYSILKEAMYQGNMAYLNSKNKRMMEDMRIEDTKRRRRMLIHFLELEDFGKKSKGILYLNIAKINKVLLKMLKKTDGFVDDKEVTDKKMLNYNHCLEKGENKAKYYYKIMMEVDPVFKD